MTQRFATQQARGELSLSAAAEALGVNRVTLYRWLKAGFLHARRSPSGRPFLLESDIDELRRRGSRDVARSLTEVSEIARSVCDRLRSIAVEGEEVSETALDDADYWAHVSIAAKAMRRRYIRRVVTPSESRIRIVGRRGVVRYLRLRVAADGERSLELDHVPQLEPERGAERAEGSEGGLAAPSEHRADGARVDPGGLR